MTFSSRLLDGDPLHAEPGGALRKGTQHGFTVPVFANLRHHKQMSRFTLRGRAKVATQWRLYCLVHNIEKIANRAMPAS